MRTRNSLVILVTFLLCGALALGACGGDDAPGGGIDAGTPDAANDLPDAASECSQPEPTDETMCDLFLSCGCDRMNGQKCTAENGGKGCGIAGAKGLLEACAGDQECAPSFVCAQYGGESRCLPWCDGAHPCDVDGACYVNILSMGNPVGQVCGQLCDLRAQDCMFDGQGCYPSSTFGSAEKGICVNAGAGAQGADCAVANDCAEGFTCTNDNKCKQLCDRSGGNMPACATGTCIALNGHTDTGVCQ